MVIAWKWYNPRLFKLVVVKCYPWQGDKLVPGEWFWYVSPIFRCTHGNSFLMTWLRRQLLATRMIWAMLLCHSFHQSRSPDVPITISSSDRLPFLSARSRCQLFFYGITTLTLYDDTMISEVIASSSQKQRARHPVFLRCELHIKLTSLLA